MDVDTRLLRSFVAVAQEGNLTRAAERLYISQPALTKQMKQLERLLGMPMFTRSRSGMTLTDAGTALAEQVPDLLRRWDQLARHTKAAAAQASRVLRVGFIASAANEATPHIIAAFNARRPQWRVDMRQASWSDPTAGLADGDVDAALLRIPFPGQENLNVEVLFSEPRCVVLPTAHPLAARNHIPFTELWDEPFVAAPADTGSWRDYWLATDQRQGHPVHIGAVTDQPDAWLSAIANGYGIALAPESARRFYARPGVTYRPVSGISPSHVAIAWAPTNDTVTTDFVRCCLDNRHQATRATDDGTTPRRDTLRHCASSQRHNSEENMPDTRKTHERHPMATGHSDHATADTQNLGSPPHGENPRPTNHHYDAV